MSGAFVPTRYFSLSYADTGELMLYNTLTGAIGAVPRDQAQLAREALRRTARHTDPLHGILQDLRDGGFLITEDVDEEQVAYDVYLRKYREEYLHLIILTAAYATKHSHTGRSRRG